MKIKRLVMPCIVAVLAAITFLPAVGHAAEVSGKWVDKATIDFQGYTYKDTNPDDSNHHYRYFDGLFPGGGGGGCQQNIKNFTDNAHAKIYLNGGSISNPCVEHNLTLTNAENSHPSLPAAPGGPTGGGGTGEEAGEQDNSCEAIKGNIMGWLMCPVIYAMEGAFNWLDEQIQALLEIDKNTYDNKEIEKAWGSIRNIAYIILVPIALVMVIGTAMGFEFISAYTVKKALPRLLIAIVFITLSWSICVFLIDFFNVVGNGTLGLLTSPFGEKTANATLSSLFEGGIHTSIFAAPGVALGVVVAIWLFWAPLLLFIGIAFLVLLVRQMFVVALLLAAPIAILAWIFPGNDRLWKAWWSLFSKLLIMFPLIMGVIAMGRIFAVIIHDGKAAGIQGAILNPLMTLAAYTLPYAFIPFTFKFAGGVFATLTGMANDKSKGLFDRARKGREEKRQRLGSGNVFRNAPKGSLRSGLNLAGAGAMNIRRAGLDPRHMRSRMRTALRDNSEGDVEKFMRENTGFNTWSGDDAKLHAAKFNSREEMERELASFDPDRFAGPDNARAREDAVTQIMNSKRDVDDDTFQRARVRAQAKTGTGYINRETKAFDAALMLQDINSAYGNDRNGAGKALAEMRGTLAQSGQIAGVAGYGTWATEMENVFRNPENANTNLGAHNAIMDDAIESASPGQAIYGKPSSAAAMGAAHARRIQAIAASVMNGDINPATQQRYGQNDLAAAVAASAGIYDAMGQASPANASAFANHLMSVEVGAPIVRRDGTQVERGTVRQYIEEQMGSNPAFVDRRRDLAQSTGERAAAERAYAAQQRAQGQQPTANINPTQGPGGQLPGGPTF